MQKDEQIETHFSYIHGVSAEQVISIKDRVDIALSVPSGAGINKFYSVFWIAPVVLGLALKLGEMSLGPIHVKSLIFALAFGFGLYGLFRRMGQKLREFCLEMREKNRGRAFVLNADAIYISTGELNHGQANAMTFQMNGLMKWAMQNNHSYFQFPFKELRHFSFEGRTLYLIPADGTKTDIEIVIGLTEGDSLAADEIVQYLKKHLPRESRSELLQV